MWNQLIDDEWFDGKIPACPLISIVLFYSNFNLRYSLQKLVCQVSVRAILDSKRKEKRCTCEHRPLSNNFITEILIGSNVYLSLNKAID